MQPWVLLEDTTPQAPLAAGLLFEQPVAEICCHEPALFTAQLAALAAWQQRGYYLVGFVSYEAGYLLHGLPCARHAFPLLHFLVFPSMQALTAAEMTDYLSAKARAFHVRQVELNLTECAYAHLFKTVQAAISDGESYQINLTCKYQFAFNGCGLGLYQALRGLQRVQYSAYACFQEYQIVSLSPELFFNKSATRLCAKPMKGTLPRAADKQLDD